MKIKDQRSPKDQDQFEIDLDHPKDRDHQCDLERSRSKIAILPISDLVSPLHGMPNLLNVKTPREECDEVVSVKLAKI